MNSIKRRLALLLALLLITGSLQEPVFAARARQQGAAAATEKGTVDPAQVTETEPLELEPESSTSVDPPEDEYYTVTVEMDGGLGGVYHGDVYDDSLGESVTDASSFVKKVKQGESLTFLPGGLYIGGDQPHDFLGWSLEPDGELVGTKTSYTPTQNCTLYAVWTCHAAFFLMDDDRFPDGSQGMTVYADRDGWVTVPEAIPESADSGWKFYRWIWSENGEPVEIQDGKFHLDYSRTVNPEWRDIKVESIVLDRTSLALEIGESAQLQVTSILPEDALTKEIVWRSSDDVTATVDENGLVTGKRRGTAVITASSSDGGGAQASCTVDIDGGKILVTYDANGGSFSGRYWDAETEAYVEDPLNFSRQDLGYGASFSTNDTILHSDPSMRMRGWSLEKDGELLIRKNENYKTDKNVTLYAVWEPVYVISIDMNGGAYLGLVHDDALGQDISSPGSFVWEIKKGESLHFEESRIYYSSDTERSFIGWSLTPNGYPEYGRNSFTPVQDCTLYALWTKAACFEARGGTFEDGTSSIRIMADEDGFVSIPALIPVCDDDNKIFGGWSLTEGGDPVDVNEDGKTQITDDCTFIPVWTERGPEDPQENTYTVRIDFNGGYYPATRFDDETQKYISLPESYVRNVKKGERLNEYLADTRISDPHRALAGWSLEPDGEIVVESMSAHTYVPSGNCTLYAVWGTAYSVTLDLTGEGFFNRPVWDDAERKNITNPEVVTVKALCGKRADLYATYATPADPSMKLEGWSLTKNGENVTSDKYFYTPEQDCTLYPLWTISRTVTIDLNGAHYDGSQWDSVVGGSVTDPEILHVTVADGESISLNKNHIIQEDASLMLTGWSLDRDGELILDQYAYIYRPQSDCTLYAVWKPFYTVKIDFDGGWNAGAVYDDAFQTTVTDPSSYTRKIPQGETLTLYPGYAWFLGEHQRDFAGWSLEKNGTLLPDSTCFTPTENCTIYAVWTSHAVFYTVGGHFPDGSITIRADMDKDGKVAVPEGIPVCDDEDKVFDGWYLPETGEIIMIDESGKISIEYNCTFNPVWKALQKAESISLNSTSLSLKTGTSSTLKATVAPADTEDKTVIWSSSNTAVVTVSADGAVKAVGKGTATITATAADGSGVIAFCTITVRQPVTKITLSKTSLTLNKGATASLTATAAPSTADNKAVKWTSSNTNVATVTTTGSVKALAKGTATITATAKDGSGIKASCSVTVKQPVTGLKISKTAISLFKGKTATLKVTVSPTTANNKTIKWTTSNKAVATVTSKGIVKGIKKGTATITAAAKDGSGKKVTCKVTVKQPVTGLKISKTSLSLKKGKSSTLKVTVSPATANNKAVKWTTSNKAVAAVTSKGVVKGIKKGTAIITATAKDGSGKKVTCKVTVK